MTGTIHKNETVNLNKFGYWRKFYGKIIKEQVHSTFDDLTEVQIVLNSWQCIGYRLTCEENMANRSLSELPRKTQTSNIRSDDFR